MQKSSGGSFFVCVIRGEVYPAMDVPSLLSATCFRVLSQGRGGFDDPLVFLCKKPRKPNSQGERKMGGRSLCLRAELHSLHGFFFFSGVSSPIFSSAPRHGEVGGGNFPALPTWHAICVASGGMGAQEEKEKPKHGKKRGKSSRRETKISW